MTREAPAQLVAPSREPSLVTGSELNTELEELVIEYFALRDLERGLSTAQTLALEVEDEVLFDDVEGVRAACTERQSALLDQLAKSSLFPLDESQETITINGRDIAITDRLREAVPQVLKRILQTMPTNEQEADSMQNTNLAGTTGTTEEKSLTERAKDFAATYWPHAAAFTAGALIGGFVGARYYGSAPTALPAPAIGSDPLPTPSLPDTGTLGS